MKRKRMLFFGIKFLVAATIAALLLGLIVMLLWNWLMPQLFAARHLGFLQAIALLALARILFGGLRSRRHLNWRYRMVERWDSMTPEERELFRAALRKGGLPWNPPAAPNAAP